MTQTVVDSSGSRVLPPELDRHYPVIVRGDGVWLEDSSGRRYLDAMSGGSMAATLGHGRRDLVEAARRQALRLAYVHNERLTNPLQERLARELVDVAPTGFTRVRFVTGGAEANELAIRLARAYHVERGEPSRWQIISQAQAYHGPTMETLALTGRSGLHGSLGPYLARHLHVPPSTRWLDPTGEAALEALDRALEEAGIELVCLAGFMRMLGDAFVMRWRNRLINIHPSLLPAFKGLKTHERVIAAGVRFTGCTVHFVRPAMDEGPIIVQSVVPVLAGDDAARLAERVLAEEHKAYPLALRLIAEGRVRVTDERVEIGGAAGPAQGALSNSTG